MWPFSLQDHGLVVRVLPYAMYVVLLYVYVEFIDIHCTETFPSFLSYNLMEGFFVMKVVYDLISCPKDC
jgi:hypothetical protein